MSFMDVETTAEAIQEDEELRLAVENLVETAAVSIKSEIETTVVDVWQSGLAWLDWLFPLLFVYQNDQSQLWEDVQKLLLSLGLLAVSFALLAPSSNRRSKFNRLRQRRREKLMAMSSGRHSFRLPNAIRKEQEQSIELRNNNYQQQQPGAPGTRFLSSSSSSSSTQQQLRNQKPMSMQNMQQMGSSSSSSRRHSTICSGRTIPPCSAATAATTSTVEQDEQETDQERFEKVYRHMLRSGYARLVLPPECKLVEKHKRKSMATTTTTGTSKDKKSKKQRRKKRDRSDDEDQPYNRLKAYAYDLIYLIKSFLSYDYMGAGRTLLRWAEAALKLRRLRRSHSHQELLSAADDEDDYDDDESKASASIASVATNNTSSRTLQRQQRQQQHQHLMTNGFSMDAAGGSAPLTPIRHSSAHSTELLSQSQSQSQSQQQQSYMDTSFATSEGGGGEEKKESPYITSMNSGSNVPASPPTLSLMEDGAGNNNNNSSVGAKLEASLQQRQSNNNNTTNNNDFESFSTPGQQPQQYQVDPVVTIGEADEATMAALRLPMSSAMSSSSSSSSYNNKAPGVLGVAPLRPSLTGGGKKKDLLENYRSSTSSRGGLHAQSNSSFLSAAPPVHSQSSGDITTIHRNHHDNSSNKQQQLEEDSLLGEPSDGDLSTRSRIQRTDSDFSASYYFETANTQESIHQMSIEAPLPDKNGYILGDEFLPDSNCTPVLVFVNSRSGPQQGHLLITQLRRLLNPIQIWDLGEDGGPEMVLESFCTFRNLRILVCGGDGTVSWIIATLEKMKLKRKWPPIAILPLGTGNDLARIHGWGGGYNNEPLTGILEEVADSYISLLDRWEMTIENRKGKVKEVKSFFNYLGVGADAQAALQVHMLRESKPQLFFSRVVNKAWYGIFGAEDIIKATSLNLPNEITLIADGVEVPLPADSQGIIVLNIDSYAGGAPIWSTGTKAATGLHGYGKASSGGLKHGHSGYQPRPLRRTRSLEDMTLKRSTDTGYHPMDRIDSVEDLSQFLTDDQRNERVTACDEPSSCQDGVLDIVSIRSAFHLGQIRVGLSNAQRLCQCREATIHIKRKVALQIDGEPWRQNICTLKVKRKPERATMLHRSEDKHGVETEMAKLLDWAEERKLIDADVHMTMTKEFSRRIEYKTRQRRNKAKDHNIMGSLKRAIGSTGAMSNYIDDYE